MNKGKFKLTDFLDSKKQNQSRVGYPNIYRTLKVVQEDGLGAEIDFSYRVKRFKCKNGCEHHNHLVCVICGCFSHLDNEQLEELQDNLAKSNGFKPQKHNFQIYGICKNCQ